MEPIKEEMLESLSFLDNVHSPPLIPVVSTVKAVVEGSFDKYLYLLFCCYLMNYLQIRELKRYYWWLNTRMPVKFEQAIAYVTKHFQPTMYIEVSPHITLRSNVRGILIFIYYVLFFLGEHI